MSELEESVVKKNYSLPNPLRSAETLWDIGVKSFKREDYNSSYVMFSLSLGLYRELGDEYKFEMRCVSDWLELSRDKRLESETMSH